MAGSTSAIAQFKAKYDTFASTLSTDIETIKTGVLALDDLITKLQSTSGTITPEDQALLDQIQAKNADILASVEAVNTTPPTVPAPAPTV